MNPIKTSVNGRRVFFRGTELVRVSPPDFVVAQTPDMPDALMLPSQVDEHLEISKSVIMSGEPPWGWVRDGHVYRQDPLGRWVSIGTENELQPLAAEAAA